MNKCSTHYFFQYTYYDGSVNSTLFQTDLTFEYSIWLKSKIEEIIEKTPEVPERLIDKLLKKAKVY